MAPKEAFEKLKAKQETDKGIPSQLIDILIAVEGEAKEQEQKAKFIEFLKLISDTLIPSDILMIELECLEANSEIHKRSIVRQKTRLYFKQSKFNLMREESEGYAKLVTELLDMSSSSASPEAMNTRVFCLIGQFNLDPNRVIDVVMQCLECLPRQKNFFISLLKEMKVNSDYLLTLLGFQFSFYQAEGKKTPYSLYVMTAALIQSGLVKLMKITGYLKPNSEGIKQGHKERTANASARSKKSETIVTTQIAIESNRNRDMDRDNGDNTPIVGVAFATVAGIQDSEDEKLLGDLNEDGVLARNQKLGLVCALLEDGEWLHAQHLIDRLPEYYAVQASPRICRAIASLVDETFNDFYREKCSHKLISGLNLKKKEDQEKKSTEGVEKVTSFDNLVERLSPLLWYLGPRIGYRASTATKLVRLITVFFEQRAKDPSFSDEKTASALIDIVDDVLLPSLSLLVNSPNVALSEDLWQLLQLFPYQHRYRLYGRWKNYHSVRHPELSVVRAKVLGRTKYVLKRLSKETVKVMGRQLGKLCHVHPMTVLEYMLSMVQTFDNFIGPVVESLRFLTSLEFDILSFCIMEQLASPDRQQLKQSDGNLSPWLQALGTMVGAIYKKYNVELAGILNYVANQLKNEKGFDLLILREIIQNMSSVESSVTATEEQLEALQGGEVLRLEAGGFSNARNKRASTRLRDALSDDNLAVGLCILIAQQREYIIHHESVHLPLKLVGEMVDQCRDTLVQFGSFLMQNFKAEEYARRMPSAADLMEDYGVPIETAMFLTRPFFLPKIIAAYDESKKLSKTLEGEGKVKLDSKQKFVFFKSAMDEVVNKTIAEVEGVKMMSTKTLSQISRTLLVTFWMLSSYDIDVPTSAYDKAVESAKKQAREIADNLDMSKSKRYKEIERLTALETRLREEQRRQTEHVERVRMWLSAVNETLFTEKGTVSVPFLSSCIMKRVLYSESDAIFCAKFALQLSAQRTTYFQTVVFFDKIFTDLLPTISGLTENEAIAFGRFLDCLLTQINKWNFDKDAFEKECAGYPGFHLKTSKSESAGPLDHTTYKYLTYKWQIRCASAFVAVLDKADAEYVLIRNCLVIMAKMFNSFPMIKDNHKTIEEVVSRVRDREKGKRDDIALKALSYAARMKIIADKMVEKGVYSPRHAAKKATPVKTNGNADPPAPATTATSSNPERKRPIAASSETPDGKKKLRTEKIVSADKKADKEKNGTEEITPAKETEDGEVADTPPPKKLRTNAPSANQNGRGREKEEKKDKDREKDREKLVRVKRREDLDEKKTTQEKKNDDKKNEGERTKAEPRRERNEDRKEKNDEKKERTEEKKEKNDEKKERTDDRRERNDERKEKNDERKERSDDKREKNDERRSDNERMKAPLEKRKEEKKESERRDSRVGRREETNKETKDEHRKDERRKRDASTEVAGPALPPSMKEKDNKIEKRLSRREDKTEKEREERRQVPERGEIDRKRTSREVSKDEPSPKMQRSSSSNKMISDRLEIKSHRHIDERISSPPHRRASKETSNRARR